jgi:hypothetical protein
MKRKRSLQRRARIQVWTYDQARRVLPYVASIMRSLREHRLDARRHRLDAERLALRPGRPDRTALIAREHAIEQARRAEERFHETLQELHTLDIYCLDPVRAQALVPFVQDEQLAWFVFDLFEGPELRFWRYHTDPLETRRPIAKSSEGPTTSLVV